MAKLKKRIELRAKGIILDSFTPAKVLEKYIKDFPFLKDPKYYEQETNKPGPPKESKEA